MTIAAALFRFEDASDAPAPARPASHDWPLMGDIVSSRGGVPEHLIRWRRAEEMPDPEPQLQGGSAFI